MALRPTQLIKVCVQAFRPRHRAYQPGLQEGGPAINQASLPPDVILGWGKVKVDITSVIPWHVLLQFRSQKQTLTLSHFLLADGWKLPN